MRVTVIAPPWYAIPPSGYGGIEWVVALLADGLVDRGHEVILFAPPGSQAEAELVPPLGACWWDWSWCSWRRGLDRHDHPAPEPAAAGDHRAQTGAGEDVGRGAGGRGRDTAGRAATIGGGGDQPAARNLGGGVTAPAAPRPRAEPSRRVATPRPPPPTGFTLVASGDVLAHGSVVARASAYGARSGRRFDFRPMFAAIRPLVSAADLAVCHLETPLSPSGRRLSGYPRFNAPPQLAAAIHHAGYDACSVASNHAMDQGVVGVAGTLAVLDRAGLLMPARPAAPRKARPRVLTVRRVRVALLSYTYGLNGFRLPRGRPWLVNLLAPGRILADARAARRAGSQFTVVFLHWGRGIPLHPDPSPAPAGPQAARRSRCRPARGPPRPCGPAHRARQRQVGGLRPGQLAVGPVGGLLPGRHPGRRAPPGHHRGQGRPHGRRPAQVRPDLGGASQLPHPPRGQGARQGLGRPGDPGPAPGLAAPHHRGRRARHPPGGLCGQPHQREDGLGARLAHPAQAPRPTGSRRPPLRGLPGAALGSIMLLVEVVR